MTKRVLPLCAVTMHASVPCSDAAVRESSDIVDILTPYEVTSQACAVE